MELCGKNIKRLITFSILLYVVLSTQATIVMGVRFSGIKIIKGATYLFLILLQFQCFGTITEDHSHFSSVLGRNRNYRVFLPPDYYQSGKRFPVIYWFHGSGGTSSQTTYKSEFEDFVNNNDLIIVNVDGSTASGATWDYSLAFEFDKRTQEGNEIGRAHV